MGSVSVTRKTQYSDLPPGANIVSDPGQVAPQAAYSDLPSGATVLHASAAQPQPEITYQQPPSIAQPAKRSGSFLQRVGILPSEEELNNIPIGKDEQAGPTLNGEGGVGDMMTQGMGNLADKGLDFYAEHGLKQMGHGVADLAHGEIATGGHKLISGAGITLLPLAPEAIVANPLMALRAAGGGFLGGKAAEKTTQLFGGNEDQQQFANDLGNIVGGAAGAKAPGLMKKVSPDLAAKASAVGGLAKDDLISHIPVVGRLVRRPSFADYAEAAKTTADPQLDLFNNTPKLGDSPLFSTNPDAAPDSLQPGNVRPTPSLDTLATFKDVPDLRVRPSQQAPQDILGTRRAAFQKPPQMGGEFDVVPPENTTAPAQTTPHSNAPNGVIYNEPSPEPSAQDLYRQLFMKKSQPAQSLADQLKEWDQIRQTHDSLESPGDPEGQAKLQGWMEAHNQQTPGAKAPGLMSAQANKTLNSAIEQANASGHAVLPPEEPQVSPGIMARAKARKGGPPSPAQATPAAQPMPPQTQAPQPQVATAANMEDLLRQSLQAKGINPDAMPPYSGPERRTDENLPQRKRLDQMTEAEKDQELLTAPKTGLPNSRAFDESGLEQSHPHVGFADMDNFKQFNTAMGKKGVDTKVLPALGEMFRRAVANEPEGSIHAYQQTAGSAGDEFLMRSQDPDAIKRVVGKINDQLANTTFSYEKADGTIVTKKGTGLSHGIGTDPESAEAASAADKKARTAAGLRTGERDVPAVDTRSATGQPPSVSDTAGRDGVQRQNSASNAQDSVTKSGPGLMKRKPKK